MLSVLSLLVPRWVLPALLVASALVYLADVLARDPNGRGDAERFLLNVLSLPVGVLGLLAVYVRWSSLTGLAAAIAIGVFLVLVGRSLREVPWTGVVAIGIAALAAYLLEHDSPVALPFLGVLALAGVVFLIAYVLLYIVEIPLRIAGIVSVPRPLLVGLAVAALVGAALVVY
jgi:hypothetical protein